MRTEYDIAVIGGGAAGCYFAALAADGTKTVALIEKKDRLGRKLSATGNGQGNVSNTEMNGGHYRSSDPALVGDIVGTDGWAFLSPFFGIFTADSRGRIYPSSRQASSLTDALRFRIERSERVDVRLNTEVCGLECRAGGFLLHLSTGETLSAKQVLLCAGGKAQKQFGTDGSAYALAEAFGHTVTPLRPSLVQLRTETEHIKTLKGLRVEGNIRAVADGKETPTCRGDVIFAEYGITGSAVFSLSSAVTDSTDVVLHLEFLPDVSAGDIAADVLKKQTAGMPRADWLAGTLPNTLGRAVMKRAKSDNPHAIAALVKDFPLRMTGTLGFDYAQVTHGGIPLGEVTAGLESRLVRGLYLAGEILDVDGDCGGYNLHWAFASAKRIYDGIFGKA